MVARAPVRRVVRTPSKLTTTTSSAPKGFLHNVIDALPGTGLISGAMTGTTGTTLNPLGAITSGVWGTAWKDIKPVLKIAAGGVVMLASGGALLAVTLAKSNTVSRVVGASSAGQVAKKVTGERKRVRSETARARVVTRTKPSGREVVRVTSARSAREARTRSAGEYAERSAQRRPTVRHEARTISSGVGRRKVKGHA